MRNKMSSELIGALLGIVFIMIFIGVGLKIAQFKYKDCIKIGHDKVYCMLNFGK